MMFSVNGASSSLKNETDSDSGQSSVTASRLVQRLTPENSSYTSDDSTILTQLSEKLLAHVFSFIRHKHYPQMALVCRRWRRLLHSPALWRYVSLRPEYGGLSVRSGHPQLLDIIAHRFGAGLRCIELPAEHITVPVLHELATKCQYLHHLTLDFSKAMQLHDFSELQAFPSNLHSLTLCLSDVIFLEGFMRRLYSCVSSLQTLHLIGTFETSSDSDDENYEVINLAKIRSHTPNLTVVNLYGVSFLDDSHVTSLAQGCIHIQCLSLSFCLKVRGPGLGAVVTRCKKLRCLLLEHCGLQDEAVGAVQWEQCLLTELDLSCCELGADTLLSLLSRLPPLTYLSLAHSEFFSDHVLEALEEQGRLTALSALDLSYTDKLSEAAVTRLIHRHGLQLKGLALAGKPKLTENFWISIIPYLKKLRIFVAGTSQGWFMRLSTKIHVDQLVVAIATHMPCLERLEMQWDPDVLRISENSAKFMDHLRLRCPRLRSISLSDGEYFELVKSSYERAERPTVVRSLTCYATSIVPLLYFYPRLTFN